MVKLLFFLLIPGLGFAQIMPESACSESDVRENNPKIRDNPVMRKHFAEPRDQSGLGWCYAFSTADVLSAEIGVPVSAMHTAILYNEHGQKDFFRRLYNKIHRKNRALNEIFEGGIMQTAVRAARKKGKICPEDRLPYEGEGDRPGAFSVLTYLESTKKNELDIPEDLLCEDFQRVGLDIDIIKFSQDFFQRMKTENLNTLLAEEVEKNCKDHFVDVPNLRIHEMPAPNRGNPGEVKEYFSRVNRLLDRGKPLELSYHIQDVTINNKGPHSSVLMGRRWKNGKCQYQIRNSWGKDCTPYDTKKVDCDEVTGSFWIADQELLGALRKMNYVETKKK